MRTELLLKVLAFCALIVGSVTCGSTNPRPTAAGTWHVRVLSLDSGALAPSSFDITFVQIPGSTFTVTMPPLVWSVGGVRYDTLPRIAYYAGDSPDSTLTFEEWCKSQTCLVNFHAHMNHARDTLTSLGLSFWDTVTVMGTQHLQPIPWAGGYFVAYK
jgi:hypothetical protein